MKRIYLIVFGTLLLLCNRHAQSQPKYDKMISAAEAAYKTGDYNKAISNLEKFKKKAFKKLGQQNAYTPTYYLLLAKYKLSSGFINEFEINLKSAITLSITLNQEKSEKHALLLIDAAELNLQNGSLKIANDYLNDAKKILESLELYRDPIKARMDLDWADVFTGQGYFSKSISLLKERERYFISRAVRQETTTDEKGNLKSRKLSESEVTQRFEEYARSLTLLVATLGKQGSLRACDSAYAASERWISKNLGKTHISYVRNQFNMANILVENGNENLPKDLDYSRTLDLLKADRKASHVLGLEIYEAYIKNLMKAGNEARYVNTKFEYEKMIEKSFKNGSIYSVRLKAVEFDSKMDRNKTKNLEADANKLITNTGELPHNNIVTATVLDFLYGLSIYKKNYRNAERYLTDIIDIKSTLFGEDAPESHLAKIQLANFYLDYTNKISEASAIYEKSFKNVVEKEIGSQHKDLLNILNHLATIYELTDRYQDAKTSLDKAVYVARAKYDDQDYQYGAELTEIARLQLKLGEYEKAEENLNKSLAILEEFRKEDDKKIFLVNAIETQATLFGIKGLFDDAEDALDRSAKIISKADVNLGIDELSAAKELAGLYIQLGRYSATETLLTKLISEYEQLYGKESIRLIEPLTNLGKLTLAKGDYTEANKIAERAKQIASGIYVEKSTKTAPILKLIGDIDYAIGDYENAEENIAKALTAQEKQFGRNHIEVAKSLGQLALIKFHKGDNLDAVEKIMTEARDIIGKRLGTSNPQYAEILKSVATVNIAEKKYDQAFSALKQAESIWRAKTGSKRNINAASIYTLTGDVYYEQKKYKEAEEFYVNAKSIYEKYFSNTHPEYVKILSKQAKVYYMEGDFKRSKRNIEEALNNYESFIKQYFPALSEREKAKYWNTIKSDFEFYNTLAFSQHDDFKDLSGKVYNYQLLTKALLLSSSIKIRERILNSNDESLKSTYTLWQLKKEFLTNALSMSSEQLVQNSIDPAALTNEVEKLERELSEKSELFGQSFENKKVTYENVQKSIGKNDVAIEMIRYRHFNHVLTDSIVYVGLYVKNDNARPKVIVMPQGHKMESKYARYFRNMMITKSEDTVSFRIFWKPIQKEIGQYSTIYLSPDGVYNVINLESLATPDGKYVIDNSNIVIVSNTKDLYLRKQKGQVKPGANKASMFGNPTFYMTADAERKILSLPGTEREVNELQQLLKEKGWKTDEYLEATASEERVKELESPKIFHIATHGFSPPPMNAAKDMTASEAELLENPLLKTGLLLRGAGDVLDKTNFNYNIESGILTAYEAMSLNLDQTDLVVLSACETGLGEITNGEGVYGLQRAFLVAGAKVLIMSMFKVDDEATQKLILNFYRKWLTSGNMRQSFVDAKKELRVDYPEPINWGAFMMIGLD